MNSSILIPVHVLTGFLGSGKTTLLNRALTAGFGAETAVIVNEFGDVGLDRLFIPARSEETIVLKSGCVCCTIRSDLVSTLLMLLAMREGSEQPFRRIMIETSGISDPLPILQTLRSDFRLLTRFRVGMVVCTVDASQGDEIGARAESLAQITAADALAITKRDIADERLARAAETAATAFNPLAEFLPAHGRSLVAWFEHQETQGEVQKHDRDQALLLPSRAAAAPHPHGVNSTVLRADAPVAWPRFAVWLTRLIFLHGDHILRTKGVLFDPDRDVWIGLHGVRRFFHPPVHLTLRNPPADGACLVFITCGLDPARIEASYRRLITDDATIITSPAHLPHAPVGEAALS
jgi:G3E family GTPase